MLIKATKRIRKFMQNELYGKKDSPFYNPTYNKYDDGNDLLNLESHFVAKLLLDDSIPEKKKDVRRVAEELALAGYRESELVSLSDKNIWERLDKGTKEIVENLKEELEEYKKKEKEYFDEKIDSFGKFIEIKRKEAGITGKALSEYMGLSRTYVSDVENNRRTPFNYKNMLLFAEIVRLTPEEVQEMFDFEALSRKSLPVDVKKYISENPYLIDYIRKIKELNVSEKSLNEIIKRREKKAKK